MLFLKSFAVLFALSLIWYAITPTAGLGFLLKGIALALAASILFTVIYPEVRGIQKGDKVVIVSGNLPSFFGRTGMALNNGKLNEEIRIKLDDGREAVGMIESYEGLFSSPKIRLIYEEKIME